MAIQQVDLDLPQLFLADDPFPLYEQIRAAGAVVWNGALQGWMIPGYDDCLDVLCDKGERFVTVGSRRPEVTFWFDAPNMIIADGPDHRRLRRGLARHFIAAAIERTWEPRIREVVAELLTPIAAGQKSVDLVADLTKLPVIIGAEMLGVPEERHEDLRRWSHTIVSNLQWGHETPAVRLVIEQAIGELNEYLDEEIDRHRIEQPDDLLTVMVNMSDWSEAEIRSSALNLLVAGYEPAARLIAECLVALERRPDQRQLIVNDLELVPNAIEEVIRCYGASHRLVREAVGDTVLGGVEVIAGDILYLLLGAANRDPSRWSDADRFDVCRPFQPHLGFGVGPHICIAVQLVRLETRVALETLLRVAPEYELGDSTVRTRASLSKSRHDKRSTARRSSPSTA